MHASSSRARNSLLLLVAVCALLCSATLAKPNSAPPKTQAAASPKLQKASILAALRAITGSKSGTDGSVGDVVNTAMRKELVEEVIAKLGKPCDEQCGKEDAAACMGKCKEGKGTKLKAILSTLRGAPPSSASPHGASTAEAHTSSLASKSRGRGFARNKPSTQYPDGVVGVDGPNAAVVRSDAFDYSKAKEGLCSSSEQARAVCGMCGGEKVLSFKGNSLPHIGTYDERFAAPHPFATEGSRAWVQSVLSQLPKDTTTTMTLSDSELNGISCLSFSPAPSPASVLSALELALPSTTTVGNVLDRSMLEQSAVWVLRVDGAAHGEMSAALHAQEPALPVRSVTVSWRKVAHVQLLPFLFLQHPTLEIEARERGRAGGKWGEGDVELRGMVNGTLDMGRSAVLVTAVQTVGNPVGSLTGGVGGVLAMGDVMKGFGCERAGLEGDVAARCDPLPEAGGDVLPDNVLERLRNMKVDSFGLQGAEIDSAFENSGGGGKRCSACGAPPPFSRGGPLRRPPPFFTPSGSSQRRLLGEEPQSVMHFVLSLAFPPSAHVTPRDLLHVITGEALAASLDLIPLSSVTLLLSKTHTPEEHGEGLIPADLGALKKGMTLRCAMGVGSDHGVRGLLSRVLGPREVVLEGSVVDGTSLELAAKRAPDLEFGGGCKMLASELTVTASTTEVQMRGVGKVLLPFREGEVLEMKGQATLDVKGKEGEGGGGGAMLLEASAGERVHTVFGEERVALGYLVIQQRLRGVSVARFILEGVLYLGSRCSVSHMPTNSDPPSDVCLSAPATVGVSGADPEQNMIVAGADAAKLGSVWALLEMIGIRSDQAVTNLAFLKGSKFSGMLRLAYAPLQHQFYSLEDHSTLLVVPAGFSGSGDLECAGQSGRAVWESDLARERLSLAVRLEDVDRPGVALLERGGHEPVVKVLAERLGGQVQVWMQGWAKVLGVEAWVLGSIDDDGGRFVIKGRVLGGMPVAMRVSFPEGGNLKDSELTIDGTVSADGLRALRARVPAMASHLCGADGDWCPEGLPGLLEGGGWGHVCAIQFTVKVKEGEKGQGQDMHALPVRVKAMLLGAEKTLPATVDLADVSDTARSVAEVLMNFVREAWGGPTGPGLQGIEARMGKPGESTCNLEEEWDSAVLPANAELVPEWVIPTRAEAEDAMTADNERQEGAQLGAGVKDVSHERYKAALGAWERERKAWHMDEAYRKQEGHETKGGFSLPKPRLGRSFAGPALDSYGDSYGDEAGEEGAGVHRARAQAVKSRLSRISQRLEGVRRKLVKEAGTEITKELEAAKGRIISQWPLTPQEEARLLLARDHHLSAVDARVQSGVHSGVHAHAQADHVTQARSDQ